MYKHITKTGKQAKQEKTTERNKEIAKSTCPECGHYEPLNQHFYNRREKVKVGLFKTVVKEYALFECRKCGCEWEIEEE